MNINPLANQKRSYRLLVLLLILSAAILTGWIIAQFFLPGKSQSESFSYDALERSNFIDDMESELMECDLILSLNLPHENRAVRQRQMNIMSQKLASFEHRLHRVAQAGNMDAETYRQFQQRAQRLQTQLQFLLEDQSSSLSPSSRRGCYQKSWERNQSCFKEYYLPRP